MDLKQTPPVSLQVDELKPIANKELKDKFLEYFRNLPVLKLAGGWIGKSDDTITIWKRDDPWFSEQIDIAKSEWAQKTARQVRSKEWLLERVMSDHFKERKEVDVNLPQPILSNVSTNPSDQ